MVAEIQPKRHTASQVKCPYLLTDRNETLNVRSACVGNAKYEFSEKYLQWKLKNGRKKHSSPRKVPFITNRSQPNLQRPQRMRGM